jgi:DNA-binding NarL/FixJ family response regulator
MDLLIPIRVLCVDDHALMRAGVTATMEAESEISGLLQRQTTGPVQSPPTGSIVPTSP